MGDVVDLELYCGALLTGWLHRRATLAVSILEQLEIDLLLFNGTSVSVHRTPYTVHCALCTVHRTPYTVHYTLPPFPPPRPLMLAAGSALFVRME